MSERRPSRLEAAVAAYRQRLLALDGAALAALESAYAPGQQTIIELIDLLVTDIEAAGTISASEAARLARATELLRLIEAETMRLAQAAGQVIPAAQQQAISQALQRAEALTVAQAPDAQRAAELARQWTGLNRGALENLVGALSDGSPLNDWLQQVVGETVDEARRVLMDGITRGVNPRDIGRDLARVSGMPLHRAQMTARTAMMDSFRSASLQVMAENSDILKGWTWSSAHGPRTCLACLARDDGTVYPLTVQFMGAHVACRCSPSPALLDDDDMPPIETGQEWFDRQPQAVKDRMVPVGLRDDFRAGRVTLDDMATLQRNPEFGDRWRQSTITEARANAKARRGGGAASPAQVSMTPEELTRNAVERAERDIWRIPDHEEAVLIDPATGQRIFHKSGEETSVTFTDAEIALMHGKILTHNHPTGWGQIGNIPASSGTSFSLADIYMAVSANLAEIRAISPGYIHSLKPGPGGWNPNNFSLETVVQVLDRFNSQVLNQNWPRIHSGEITIEQANREHGHQLAQVIAERWRLEYERIPIPWET